MSEHAEWVHKLLYNIAVYYITVKRMNHVSILKTILGAEQIAKWYVIYINVKQQKYILDTYKCGKIYQNLGGTNTHQFQYTGSL